MRGAPPGAIRRRLKSLDARLWRSAFGDADYLQLRPSVARRLAMLARLPAALVAEPHPEPVFVVGCPRSGTTILWEILRRSPALDDLGQESHWIWERPHPPADRPDHSQALDAGDVDAAGARWIRRCYRAAFGSRRFVDKCPANALRVPAIRAVFPRARIVAIVRNGPDNVSSLIDTWRDPDRFPGFRVPIPIDVEGYGRPLWVHVLEPGWQEVARAPIEVVCAHQWRVVNERLLAARAGVPDADWIDVRYEDLVTDPEATARGVFERLGLPFVEPAAGFARGLADHVVNTRSAPGVGKWAERNRDRVERILPSLAPTMERLGYEAPAVPPERAR